jgi:hypothetical protein
MPFRNKIQCEAVHDCQALLRSSPRLSSLEYETVLIYVYRAIAQHPDLLIPKKLHTSLKVQWKAQSGETVSLISVRQFDTKDVKSARFAAWKSTWLYNHLRTRVKQHTLQHSLKNLTPPHLQSHNFQTITFRISVSPTEPRLSPRKQHLNMPLRNMHNLSAGRTIQPLSNKSNQTFDANTNALP